MASWRIKEPDMTKSGEQATPSGLERQAVPASRGKRLTSCLVWLTVDSRQADLLQFKGEVSGSTLGRSSHMNGLQAV